MSRPRLTLVKPADPPPPNSFAILGVAERSALADISALTARLNRGLGGPYSTRASLDAAEFQALELADAAHALAKAIRKARANG